ncbi:MAG: hypothetical protein ACLP8Y_00465 [Thermoplasmata archaeon]
MHRPSDLHAFLVFAVIVVVLVILLPVALYFGTQTGGVTSTGVGGTTVPIGSVFAVRLPEQLTRTSSLVTVNACVTAGDSVYEIQVETSSITFGEVLFHVQDINATVFENTGVGSFALVTASGAAAAYSDLSAHAGLAMPTTWAQYAAGYSGGSSLISTTFSILVDLGQTTPGTGLYLVAIGVNGCNGSTTPVSLG